MLDDSKSPFALVSIALGALTQPRGDWFRCHRNPVCMRLCVCVCAFVECSPLLGRSSGIYRHCATPSTVVQKSLGKKQEPVTYFSLYFKSVRASMCVCVCFRLCALYTRLWSIGQRECAFVIIVFTRHLTDLVVASNWLCSFVPLPPGS